MTEEPFDYFAGGTNCRTVLENVAGSRLVTDLDLEITGASRGACKLFGCQASELLGKNARILFSPAVASVFDRLSDGWASETVSVEAEVVRSDGLSIPIWITGDRIETPAGASILLSIYDVARFNPADDKLSAPFLLLDQARDALIVRDLEDRIRFWNKGAERLYGWQADEVTGQNMYDLIFPGHVSGLEQQMDDLAKTGDWSGQLRQVTRGRRIVTVESHWKVHRNASGEPQYVTIVNRDITEKKALEAEVLRAQRMECIGALASAIAHDLNNVLPAVLISLRGLRQEHVHNEDREALESSLFRAEHASKLITRLLSLVKETEEEPTAVDVGHVIAETAKIIKTAFPKTIEIRTVIGEDVPTIAGNQTHLYQVLLNLCLNARDAMASGGTLTIEAATREFAETDREPAQVKPGEYVLVKVTDTGVGIPAENADKIFEPSFTTKDRGQGSGLGLFSVARIIRNHNGFITLSSEPKRGTQFFVYIPAQERAADLRTRS
jgi:two-component system cell cycle sensor histidine kinase/response regulator CckA